MTAARSILVTGGNGFIGRHLVQRLLRDEHQVTLLQRSPDRVDSRTELLSLSHFDAEGIATAVAGRRFDWVFHMLGYGVHPKDRNIETMYRANVEVTHAVVDIASRWGPRAVVIAGSGSEYSLTGVHEPVTEDHPLEQSKIYGASKATGTLGAVALAAARQTPFAACRIFGVYGPGEAPHRLLPSLIRGLRDGARIPLSPGLQKRDFLYVDDVVEALVKVAVAAESELGQSVFNVGTGQPIAVRQFVQEVAAMLNAAESCFGFGDLPMRPDEAMMFSGNPALLHSATGWKATVDLKSGIRRCLNSQIGALA